MAVSLPLVHCVCMQRLAALTGVANMWHLIDESGSYLELTDTFTRDPERAIGFSTCAQALDYAATLDCELVAICLEGAQS